MSENRSEIEIKKELDATGLFCPEPLLVMEDLNKSVEIGQCFRVLSDDPQAEKEFKHWADKHNVEIIDHFKKGDVMTFTFRKRN